MMEEQLCGFSEGKTKRWCAALNEELPKEKENSVCKEGYGDLSIKRLGRSANIDNYYV